MSAPATSTAASSAPILQVSGSTMRFGGLIAVNDVSFKVGAGQVLGLIGPNGAGKSTLFNLITGVLNPTAGDIRFFDKRVSDVPLHRRCSLGMARTFQIVRVFHGLTVLENVMMGFHHKLIDGFVPSLLQMGKVFRTEKRLREEARALLAFVGLERRAEDLIEHLPHGQLRMVEIARAQASGPKLLLLDEPAAGLNEQETDHLAQIIRTINQSGITVLLVEHDIDFIMGLSNHIVVLDHGTKIAEGSPTEIQVNEQVIEAYLGRKAAHAES
jgi:branched-chain amino acid transport system ATP-binding protein